MFWRTLHEPACLSVMFVDGVQSRPCIMPGCLVVYVPVHPSICLYYCVPVGPCAVCVLLSRPAWKSTSMSCTACFCSWLLSFAWLVLLSVANNYNGTFCKSWLLRRVKGLVAPPGHLHRTTGLFHFVGNWCLLSRSSHESLQTLVRHFDGALDTAH